MFILSLLIPWLPALSAFLAVILQELALPWQAWIIFRPDFLLVSLFYWRLYRPDRLGFMLAFASGLFVDLLSQAPVGLNALSKTLLLYAIDRFAPRLRSGDFLIILPAVLLLAGLDQLMQLGLVLLFHDLPPRWELLFGRPLGTMLLAPLWIAALIHVHQNWLEDHE
ncbi:MAG: rod shape-determining protein MreD [Magnetococcus sp. WYHC-3]